jgi:hypothetical protein
MISLGELNRIKSMLALTETLTVVQDAVLAVLFWYLPGDDHRAVETSPERGSLTLLTQRSQHITFGANGPTGPEYSCQFSRI